MNEQEHQLLCDVLKLIETKQPVAVNRQRHDGQYANNFDELVFGQEHGVALRVRVEVKIEPNSIQANRLLLIYGYKENPTSVHFDLCEHKTCEEIIKIYKQMIRLVSKDEVTRKEAARQARQDALRQRVTDFSRVVKGLLR